MRLSRPTSRCGKIVFFLLILAGIFITLGVALNVAVMIANGGKMPVAAKSEDVLFVIGSPKLGVEYFHSEESFAKDVTHKKMDSETYFALLADRIPLSLAWIKPENTYPLLWAGMELAQLPVGIGGTIMSFGDIIILCGLAITIPFLIFLVPAYLLFRLLKRIFRIFVA